MGTRGLTGFMLEGNELFAYQQYDSYPEGVGLDVLKWARSIEDWSAVAEQIKALVVVDESDHPTEEQIADLAKRGGYWQNVSSGDDWYSYLRGTQGHPDKILESGYIAAQSNPREADIWIEYTWAIDLDNKLFLGYEGSLGGKLISSYPLDALPTEEQFLKDSAPEDE